MRVRLLILAVASASSLVLTVSRSPLAVGEESSEILSLEESAEKVVVVEGEELVEEHLTLVTTIDGRLHAVDSSRNEKLWTTTLPGGSMATSHQVEMNRRAVRALNVEGGGAQEGVNEIDSASATSEQERLSTASQDDVDYDAKSDFSVIPSADGSVLVHNMQGMRKTSVKARMLAEKSPFLSQEGFLFTGQTNSRILGVDIESGKIVHDSGMADSGTKKLGFSRKDPLWIGRVDYTVRAFSQITGREQFNLTYSELKPLSSLSINGAMAYQGSGLGRGPNRAKLNGRSLPEIGAPLYPSTSNAHNRHNHNRQEKHQQTVMSTPGGDVAFSNGASMSMGSAVVSAFSIRLRKKLVEDGVIRPKEYMNIQPLKVMYRMNSLLVDDQFAEGDDEDEHEDDPLDDGFDGNDMVVVQSLTDGGLYALEIPKRVTLESRALKSSLALQNPQNKLSLPLPAQENDQHKPTTTAGGDFLKLSGVAAGAAGASSKTGKVKLLKGIISPPLSRGKIPAPGLNPKGAKNKALDSKPTRNSNDCVAFPRAFSARSETGLDAVGSSPICLLGNHKLLVHPSAQDFFPGGSIFADDSFLLLDDDRSSKPLLEPKPRSLYTVLHGFMRFIEFVLIGCAVATVGVLTFLFWIRKVGLLPEPIAVILDSLIKRNTQQPATNLLMPVMGKTSGAGTETVSEQVVEYDEAGRKSLCVGSIHIFSHVLGFGSHGTTVLKGSLNGRPVAVKRMLSQFNRAADREIALLIRSDGHPNVVRYFLREQKGDFVYLALQLCKMSLRDFVMHVQRSKISNRKKRANDSSPPTVGLTSEERKLTAVDIPDEARTALLQIAQGLAHLHSQRIVHRDIKPHNILLALPDEMLSNPDAENVVINSVNQLGNYILKISDMGLSKQLDREEGSFASMSFSMPFQNGEESSQSSSSSIGKEGAAKVENPVGTIGWQAPELMALRGMGSAKVDNDEEVGEEEEGDDDHDNEDDDEKYDDYVDEREKDSEAAHEPSSDTTTEETSITAKCNTVHRAYIDVSLRSTAKAVRKTQTVDIFSLGCVFHYVLVPGEHPFGQWFEREANIMAGKLDLSHLQHVPDASDLLMRMLRIEPHARPSSIQVCSHPFFWSCSKRLDFLTDLSDRLEHEPADSALVLAIERYASSVIGRSWDKRLDAFLMEDMNKYRKYDPTSVRDLLRIIRNKRHHFHELSEHAQALLTPVPMAFVGYFEGSFPELLMHCVRVACTHLHRDKVFLVYCHAIAPLLAVASLVPTADAVPASISVDASAGETCSIGSPIVASEHGENESRIDLRVEIGESVVVWQGSSIAGAANCRGWYREMTAWVDGTIPGTKSLSKQKHTHLIRCSTDFRYRSRLCSHWETTCGTSCPMRKKSKCDFAHGPLELRIRENRRERWGKLPADPNLTEQQLLRYSGGEDVLGAARSVGRVPQTDGISEDYIFAGGVAIPAGAGSRSTLQPSRGNPPVASGGGGGGVGSQLRKGSLPFYPKSGPFPNA